MAVVVGVTDLALDPLNGDLVIEAGDFALIRGPEAIAQDANLRVALFKGEWPLDLRVGIDYRSLFFDVRPPDTVVRAVYDQVLRETAGVESVTRLTLSYDRGSRTLTVQGTVKAADGSVVPVFRDIILDPTKADEATLANAQLGSSASSSVARKFLSGAP